MNNDFIQELKEKRERYGVSQSRLAVACSISREYYNRIENGKTQLTEALKEELKKQIERFNPEEPLFLLIDYFRVRFPTTDALTVIQSVMHLKEKYFLHEDYGKYGYAESYLLGDIQVMVSHNEVLGVLMEMKGKGCRQMESYLLAQERSWYDFMLDCLTAGGVVLGLGGMLLSITSSIGKERVRSLPQKGSASLWTNLSDLFKNKMVMLILAGSILSGLSLTVPQIYFFKYKVSLNLFGFEMDGTTASFFYGIFAGLPGTLAMLIVPQFAKKVGGMKNILILSCFAAIVMRVLCFFVGYEGYRI